MSTTSVALEGVTDQDLFDEANADEVTTDEVVPEAPEPVAEQTEQPRDDAGRFAEKSQIEQLTEVAAEIKADGEKPPVDDNAAMVPSWRVREINEEKRQIAEKYEADKLLWQQERQRLSQPAPQPAAVEKVTKPDPLLDPEGYEAYIEQRVEAKILNDRRESSLAQAHKTYKGEFEEAYAAAQKQVDPVLKMKMQNSRDPGETLIEWHREQKTRAEVGNDPNAFFQKRLDAWLADPANQAKVIEKARGTAQTQPGAVRQPGATQLPPSLTRVAAATSDASADDDDTSNEGLWRHANA